MKKLQHYLRLVMKALKKLTFWMIVRWIWDLINEAAVYPCRRTMNIASS